MTKLDLTGVEEWAPNTTPPPGTYPATLDDVKAGESKNGYPQLEMSWSVLGGNFAGAEIRDWLTITEGTRGKLVNLLKSVGRDIPAEFDLDEAAPSLIGGNATVVLRQEPKYDDPTKMVTRVAGYKPLSDEAAKAASGGNGAASGDDGLPF